MYRKKKEIYLTFCFLSVLCFIKKQPGPIKIDKRQNYNAKLVLGFPAIIWTRGAYNKEYKGEQVHNSSWIWRRVRTDAKRQTWVTNNLPKPIFSAIQPKFLLNDRKS